MFDNGEIRASVHVIRQDGQVVYDVLARETFEFGTDIDAAERYAERVRRWLALLPTPDFDPDVFSRRQVGATELLAIIDKPWRFEQP